MKNLLRKWLGIDFLEEEVGNLERYYDETCGELEEGINRLNAAVFPEEVEEPEETFKWVLDVYGDIPFPYETLENPHGDALAVWRVLEFVTVFLPNEPIVDKPIFETNSKLTVLADVRIFGYRKVLSGKEANGGQYVVVCDPAGADMSELKLYQVIQILRALQAQDSLQVFIQRCAEVSDG